MTRTETLTFCLECGARVTDWTDGECPESTDKRHGPLKDVQYTCAADVVELTLRIHDLEAAVRPFAGIADEADALGHLPGSTAMWRLAYNDLAPARDALKGKGLNS